MATPYRYDGTLDYLQARISMMDRLKEEVEKGNSVRAAKIAASLNVSKKELLDLRKEALWQMAAVYRNAPRTKKLAQ